MHCTFSAAQTSTWFHDRPLVITRDSNCHRFTQCCSLVLCIIIIIIHNNLLFIHTLLNLNRNSKVRAVSSLRTFSTPIPWHDLIHTLLGAIHILRTQKTADFDPPLPLPVALRTFSYPPICVRTHESSPPPCSAPCVYNVIYDRYFNIGTIWVKSWVSNHLENCWYYAV